MDTELKHEIKLVETRLSDKIDSQSLILSQILEQVKHTNERVSKLEEWRLSHEINTANELMEYRFLKKYPRYMLLVITIMAGLAVLSFIKN